MYPIYHSTCTVYKNYNLHSLLSKFKNLLSLKWLPFSQPNSFPKDKLKNLLFFLTGYPISLRKMYYTRKKWFANHNSGSFFFPLLNTTDFWLNIMLHLENIEVKWLSLLTLAFPCRWMEDNGSAVVGIIYTHASMQICYSQKYQPNTPSQSLKWP